MTKALFPIPGVETLKDFGLGTVEENTVTVAVAGHSGQSLSRKALCSVSAAPVAQSRQANLLFIRSTRFCRQRGII